MIHSTLHHITFGLLIAVAISTLCMGMLGVCYIGIDYRNRYHCPSSRPILRSISLGITTLYLNVGRSNTLYEQRIDSLLRAAKAAIHTIQKW